ncbi:MAG TPA: ATP phosphoribosyltransferase regulatory subunit, partial [bacterium]|nr:ATP phosphoribosyltransferase regulatory subunit [bacterium]
MDKNAKEKLNTQPYKGARDFYPEDMKIRNFIFENWKKVCKSYGYEEYDGPFLESFDLYAAKSGEELVNEQLYSFVDRGKRKVAIRPEMTPTLARMIAKKINEIVKPVRWFSIANFWRYEKPQRGR